MICLWMRFGRNLLNIQQLFFQVLSIQTSGSNPNFYEEKKDKNIGIAGSLSTYPSVKHVTSKLIFLGPEITERNEKYFVLWLICLTLKNRRTQNNFSFGKNPCFAWKYWQCTYCLEKVKQLRSLTGNNTRIKSHTTHLKCALSAAAHRGFREAKEMSWAVQVARWNDSRADVKPPSHVNSGCGGSHLHFHSRLRGNVLSGSAGRRCIVLTIAGYLLLLSSGKVSWIQW